MTKLGRSRGSSLAALVLLGLVLTGCTPEPPFGFTRVGDGIAIAVRHCEVLRATSLSIQTPGPNGRPDDEDDEIIWQAEPSSPMVLGRLVVLADLGPQWAVSGTLPRLQDRRSKLLVVATTSGVRSEVFFAGRLLKAGYVNTWNKSGIPLAKYSKCNKG